MKYFRFLLWSSLAAIMMLSCGSPTKRGYEQTLNSYVGRHVDELITHNRPPDSQYTLENGQKIYTWVRSGQYTGKRPDYTIPRTAQVMTDSGRMTTIYYNQIVPGESFSKSLLCETRVTTTKDGFIVSWQGDGNHCLGYEDDQVGDRHPWVWQR